jgi:hypothetical protein
MIDTPHAEGIGAFLQSTSNTAHPQHSQHLLLRIMAERTTAQPLSTSQSHHATIKPAQGANNQEQVDVGGSIIDRGWNIRDANTARGARGDIDLIVSGAVMCQELQGRGQRGQQRRVDEPRYADGAEGAVRYDDAVEGAGLRFGDEGGAVVGFGGYELADLGEGGPLFVRTEGY